MRQGADTLKRVHFELGGKNPVIVFDDADLERAVDAAVFMIYSLNGERCTSSSRLLVQDTVYDEVCAKVAERAARIRVGHPLDPETVIGPLIHPVHEKKVLSYFEKAVAEGATIATGGEKLGETGCYVAPTLFTHATNEMAVSREEIFGPVLTVMPFDTVEEAISMANDTDYGLAASVWTKNIDKALMVTRRVQAGRFWVNTTLAGGPELPLGGFKQSGWGREAGMYGVEEYTQVKSVHVEIGKRTPWIA